MNFNSFVLYAGSALKDNQAIWSPLADAERKDSLSVNVEFVKFHLSRSRKLNFETSIGKNTEQSHAIIRFSSNFFTSTFINYSYMYIADFKYELVNNDKRCTNKKINNLCSYLFENERFMFFY